MVSIFVKNKLILPLVLYILFKQICQERNDLNSSTLKREQALRRRLKKRLSWPDVSKRISDIHFRRMFRMTRACFNLLCNKIIRSVGERAFLSEAYIDAFLDNELTAPKYLSGIYKAHLKTSGGFISGEVKLAISIRLLAGGSALDLSVLFDISEPHCKTVFIKVLKDWIIKPNIGNIDIEEYLNNEDAMKRVAIGFSQRSNGVLRGAIGAIDGWLVKITRPWMVRDAVSNPASFFSRKGFYALNVQCICDHDKKVMWASYSNRGSSHDSTCFRDSHLYKSLLKPMQEELFRLSYFILGDSAYAIESFILPPYDNSKSSSPEDAYNFYHSSARITVECTFGEIDRRWGIFWSAISYSLFNTCIICEGAMHLHNYLVDYRQSLEDPVDDYRKENEIFEYDRLDHGIISSVISSDSTRPRGRPTNDEIVCRQNGLLLRDHLRASFASHNMHRPV